MPLVQNPSIGAGAAALLTTTTAISSAQIKAIKTTPITVIPSPGAGKLIVVLGAALVYDFGTVAYSAVTDRLELFYDGAASDDVIAQCNGLMTSAASAFLYESGIVDPPGSILPGDDANAVLIATFGGGFNVGPIVTTTLGAGGLGYVANDTGTIAAGGNDATYQVLTVGAGGAVLTYSITAPGTNYAVANGVMTNTGGAQPGVGVGFTVNITAVQTGDGTLKVVTYYQIIPVP